MLRRGSVAELAAEMTGSRKSSILLLGTDFAERAGVPGVEDVARRVLDQEDEGGKLVEAFRAKLQEMSTLERYSLLRAFYRGQPIPAAYRDVARIIRDGEFSHVITCSVDLLLEEALKGVGLKLGDDYQVVDPLISSVVAIRPPSESERLLPIVRVHEALTPGEIEDLLELTARTFKLPSQVLVLGYDLECEQVNTLLSELTGEIWWVAPDPAVSTRIASIGPERDVRTIPAEAADLSKFFGDLIEALLSASPSSGPSVQEWRVDSLPEPKIKGPSPRTEASKDFMQQVAPPPHDKITSGIRRPLVQKEEKAPRISPAPIEKIKEPLPDLPNSQRDQPRRKEPPAVRTPQPVGPKDALRHKLDLDEEKWTGFQSQSAEFSPDVTSMDDLVELREVPRPPAKDPRAKETRREESLRQQLRESREILARLERQELVRGRWDVQQLQSEIAYQRDQIARLEQEWSRLPSTRRRVEESLKAIVEAAERAQTKPEVVEFLRSQAATVSEEQERKEPEEPNEDLIAAAISGVVLLAGRLGDKVVDPEVVRVLASLAPGASSGRV